MNKDVAKHALSETEWRVLQDFELILTVRVSHFPTVIILIWLARFHIAVSRQCQRKRHQFWEEVFPPSR